MALTSAIIGTLAALGGVRMSVVANTPVGPSIVVVAVVMFCLSLLARRMRPFI
jgi:ABC-type Mn2+/Zn2+ transport system permease subunit